MLLVFRDPALGHVTEQDGKQSTPVHQAMERPDAQVAKVEAPGLAQSGDQSNEAISSAQTAPATSGSPVADQTMQSATAAPKTTPVTGLSAPVSVSPSAGLVDLNTASLEQLNALQGGGLIGRAIIRRRPYTSVEDLLVKQVLSRSTYKRIADQVTVR
jgi:DNA uptake protein ComE-like DNA-binding protein